MRITVESGHGMSDSGGSSSLWRRGQYDVALTSLTTAVLGDAGVLVLTGDPGTGKTAVLHALAADVQARGVVVGRLLYPVLADVDFLSGIAEAFGLPGGFTTAAEFEEAFEHFAASVAAHGGRLLLIIDDAHSLPKSSLREVRRLVQHRWDDGRARLSVVLAGDEGLSAAVRTAKIERTVAVQLHPLTPEESAQYLAFLLRAVDSMESMLPPQVLEQICREARGIPHVLTVLFNRAIARTRMSERRLLGEVTTTPPPPPPAPPRRSFTVPHSVAATMAVVVLLMVAAAGAAWYSRHGHGVDPATADSEGSGSAASVRSVAAPASRPAPGADRPREASILPPASSPAASVAEAEPQRAVSSTAPARDVSRSQPSSSATASPPPASPAAIPPAATVRTEAPASPPAVSSPSVPRAVRPPAPAASERTSVQTPAPHVVRHAESRAAVGAAPRDAEKPPVRLDPAEAAEPRAAQAPSEASRPSARPTRSSEDVDPGAIIDWMLKDRGRD